MNLTFILGIKFFFWATTIQIGSILKAPVWTIKLVWSPVIEMIFAECLLVIFLLLQQWQDVIDKCQFTKMH